MNELNEKLRNTSLMALIVGIFSLAANSSQANTVEGAWALQSYTLKNERIEVSGLLVLNDGSFGMIYTMGAQPELLSARAHAGTYKVEQDRLLFDVGVWIQKIGETAGPVPGVIIGATMSFHDNTLVLHFDGGSTQELERLEPDSALAAGVWQARNIRYGSAGKSAKGLLVAADGRFVLVYADEKTDVGRAYGGIHHELHQGQNLQVRWSLQVGDGAGSVFSHSICVHDGLQDLILTRSAGSIDIREPDGNVVALRPQSGP